MTDMVERMVAIASASAAKRGLVNVETRVTDAAFMPFGDRTFDAVLCRFGFMFFPDMAAAAEELGRVTRPGGRVSVAVWAQPEKNPWATITMGTIARHVVMEALPPDSPGLFRCAPDGLMRDVLGQAGFREISDEEVPCPLVHANPEAYWRFMTDVAAPVVAGLAKADEATQHIIRDEVLALAQGCAQEGLVRMAGAARVVTGTR